MPARPHTGSRIGGRAVPWLALAALLGLPTQAFAAKARLSISVEPERVVLGEVDKVVVRVELQGDMASAGLQLSANVGRIEAVSARAAGMWTATYHPPEQFHPQLAIFGAVAHTPSGPVSGFQVVPLWGNGEAQVVSAPRAQVKVRIGQLEFGPVQADRNGLAMVPVKVPPGIRKAKAGPRTIDLKMPAIGLVGAVAEDGVVAVDLKAGTTVRILAVTEAGDPDASAVPVARAARGRVSKVIRIRPGEFAVRYVPPNEVGDGKDLITVWLERQAASRIELSLNVTPGTAQRLDLQVSAPAFRADGGPMVVEARLADAHGNPTNDPPSLAADLGQLDLVQAAEPGRFTARWELPGEFKGRTTARVQATLARAGRESLTAEARVVLQVGEPAALAFGPLPEDAVADGQTANEVTVGVRDRFGNPVAGVELEPSASVGQLGPGTSAGDGCYTLLRYTPPLSRRPVVADLEARLGELSAGASLPLAEKGFWLALTPVLGVSSNLQSFHSPYFAAELSLGLGALLRGLSLDAEVGYAWSDRDAGQAGISSRLSVIPMLASVGYRFWVHPRVHLRLAGGGGGYLLISSVKLEEQPAVESRSVAAGGHGGVELGVHFGPGHGFVLLRYAHAEAGGTGGVSGNVAGLQAVAGYRFGLF